MARRSETSFARNRRSQRSRNDKLNPRRVRSQRAFWESGNPLPFIFWDGEGYNAFVVNDAGETTIQHRYMLFGSSESDPITGINLSTEQCLAEILRVKRENPDSIFVGFSFEYDVNMIIGDFAPHRLYLLKKFGTVRYKGYKIEHIPRKLLRVSKDGVSATIFDTFGYFGCGYVAALRKYGVGTEAQVDYINAGKGKRGGFTYADIEYVEKYWRAEVNLGPHLIDKVRDACYSAGYFITEWHGPGALAAFGLKYIGAKQWHGGKNVPSEVKAARAYAYAGGRFQGFMGGYYIGDVYTADLNSAYAYAATLLPRLDNGEWKRYSPERLFSEFTGAGKNVPDFGLYRVAFKFDKFGAGTNVPFPLFHRSKDNSLSWGPWTEGWYWGPEARLVIGSPYCTVLEAWVYRDDGTYPFREWIEGAFNRRLVMQEKGDPVEKAYKWMLAAMYGAFARRVGWNRITRVAPSSHQIEWAGYITSKCRALVQIAAHSVARTNGLVSIDTDGVTSLTPFGDLPGGKGNGLGQWKCERFTGVLYWQNGIYWLRGEDGVWQTPKTRGMPKGTVDIQLALDIISKTSDLRDQKNAYFTAKKRTFTGYGRALQNQLHRWRTWEEIDNKVMFGGTGKSVHAPEMCGRCSGTPKWPMHTFQILPADQDDMVSHKHVLPWLERDPDLLENSTEEEWELDDNMYKDLIVADSDMGGDF
jgi:hypothetical protein